MLIVNEIRCKNDVFYEDQETGLGAIALGNTFRNTSRGVLSSFSPEFYPVPSSLVEAFAYPDEFYEVSWLFLPVKAEAGSAVAVTFLPSGKV